MSLSASHWQMCPSDDSIGPVVQGCRHDFDFTLQFENVVFSIVPSTLFLVASGCRVAFLLRKPRLVDGKTLQWTKVAILTAHLVLQLTFLVLSCTTNTYARTTGIAAAILSVLVAITSLGLSWTEHSRCLRPSILFSLYLFITLLLDAVRARTLSNISSSWPFGRLFASATCLKVAILFVENFVKARWALVKQHSPESSIGIFSIISYFWINPLLLLGYRKLLDVGDLYPLDPSMAPQDLDPKFWTAWNKTNFGGARMHLMIALVRVMKWQLLVPVLPRLARMGFTFCQPFLIQAVQVHLSTPDGLNSTPKGNALIGATTLVFLGMAASLSIHQYYNQRASTVLRGILVAGIFRQATVIDPSSDNSVAITLISTDVERILQVFGGIHEVWANILEITFGAWMLYVRLGLAFLVPVGLILTCFLGSAGVGKVALRYQKAWLTATDRRIDATTNLIANIKNIKILGLTKRIGDLVQSMRESEVQAGAIFRTATVYAVFFAFAPMMISPVLTFAATNRDLDTTRAFASLSFLRLLTIPLASLFQLLPAFSAAMACFDRVAIYLEADLRSDYRTFCPQELVAAINKKQVTLVTDQFSTSSDEISVPCIVPPVAFLIKDGYFGWEKSRYILNQLDLVIPSVKLTMIVGPIGSGKSTFCKALLGEVPFAKGHLSCNLNLTGVGFCDQTPFIPNTSVRTVIIGDGVYNDDWYEKVVEAVALRPDIAKFANGDQYLVGSNGSNLSGGQRHRLTIARALYTRPKLFIFDDVFSGLDGPTGELIFRNLFGLNGLLRAIPATVILCSHTVRQLPSADHIIALGADGRVVEQGTYEQLKTNQSYIHSLDIQDTVGVSDQAEVASARKAPEFLMESISSHSDSDLNDRQRQVGDLAVYKKYLSSAGWVPMLSFIILSLLAPFCDNFATIWLKFWSDYNTRHPQSNSRRGYYLGIYATIQILGLVGFTATIAVTSIIVVRRTAPLSLFDYTPAGTLLNRFIQDINILDTELEEHFSEYIFCIEVSVGMAIVIATGSPYVAISYPFLGASLYLLQKFYLKTSRQLRFLDLEAKSPLFSHLLETLSGLPTLRAFGWIESSIITAHSLVNESQLPSYFLLVIQTWLNVVLALLVAALAILVVALAVHLRTSPGFAGASLVTLMSFGSLLGNMMKEWTLLELSVSAVSRIESFCTNVKSEHTTEETQQPRGDWPNLGAIDIENTSASYRRLDRLQENVDGHPEDEYLTLRNITLRIEPGEKVAIVGRTGSGKSSVILLLLRLLDPLPSDSQNVSIDGIALRNINRDVVRSRIIALPQETFFLPDGNSYRTNLDPYGQSSTASCEAALQEVGMKSLIEERGGLDEPFRAGSLSQGQKQLFTIARAVLRAWTKAGVSAPSHILGNRKAVSNPGGILLLDEVTSSVDSATGLIIQRVIRKHFGSYTIIAITHREDNMQDFDRIVTMENGCIKEVRRLGE